MTRSTPLSRPFFPMPFASNVFSAKASRAHGSVVLTRRIAISADVIWSTWTQRFSIEEMFDVKVDRRNVRRAAAPGPRREGEDEDGEDAELPHDVPPNLRPARDG